MPALEKCFRWEALTAESGGSATGLTRLRPMQPATARHSTHSPERHWPEAADHCSFDHWTRKQRSANAVQLLFFRSSCPADSSCPASPMFGILTAVHGSMSASNISCWMTDLPMCPNTLCSAGLRELLQKLQPFTSHKGLGFSGIWRGLVGVELRRCKPEVVKEW